MSWNRKNFERGRAYRMLEQLAALPATIREPREALTMYLREDDDARAAYVRRLDEDARLADAKHDAWRM
jgi:hypothetical protein